MGLKDVKNKIRSVHRTSTVTKAMEAVSAVKMRKTQEQALSGRPYAATALTILEKIIGSFEGVKHPLAEWREKRNRACIVVVTPDKGLAGSLVSTVLKEAESTIKKTGLTGDQIKIVAVGRKARDYFMHRGYDVIEEHIDLQDKIPAGRVDMIAKTVTEGYEAGLFDECHIVFPHFRSTFDQYADNHLLLPLSVRELRSFVEGIVPETGKYSDVGDEEDKKTVYTFEPSREAVLGAIIPQLVQINVYHALLEAKASEHSARMVAMKNASDKARDLAKELNLVYNKKRQAMITSEVSEIVGGIESMSV